MLNELNNELNSHIQDADTQGDLKRIRDLLTLKIASLDNLAMTNTLLEEDEKKSNMMDLTNVNLGEEHE